MKKTLFILAVIFTMATMQSCSGTYMAISTHDYREAKSKVKQMLYEAGYVETGSSSETKRDVVVTGASYSKQTGYGTAMKNDVSVVENYIFTDTVSNSRLSYSVIHSELQVWDGMSFYDEVRIRGCNSEDYKQYEKCDEIRQTFNNIERKEVEPPDEPKKRVTLTGVVAVVGIVAIIAVNALSYIL